MEGRWAVAALALTMCPWEQRQEGEDKVHSLIQLGTQAYQLPYSRHVVSTFKNFSLNRRGLNHQ
jgi:hypothetical protein